LRIHLEALCWENIMNSLRTTSQAINFNKVDCNPPLDSTGQGSSNRRHSRINRISSNFPPLCVRVYLLCLVRCRTAKRKTHFREDWEDKASHDLPDSTAVEPEPNKVKCSLGRVPVVCRHNGCLLLAAMIKPVGGIRRAT